jgi:hypothetical protein
MFVPRNACVCDFYMFDNTALEYKYCASNVIYVCVRSLRNRFTEDAVLPLLLNGGKGNGVIHDMISVCCDWSV